MPKPKDLRRSQRCGILPACLPARPGLPSGGEEELSSCFHTIAAPPVRLQLWTDSPHWSECSPLFRRSAASEEHGWTPFFLSTHSALLCHFPPSSWRLFLIWSFQQPFPPPPPHKMLFLSSSAYSPFFIRSFCSFSWCAILLSGALLSDPPILSRFASPILHVDLRFWALCTSARAPSSFTFATVFFPQRPLLPLLLPWRPLAGRHPCVLPSVRFLPVRSPVRPDGHSLLAQPPSPTLPAALLLHRRAPWVSPPTLRAHMAVVERIR